MTFSALPRSLRSSLAHSSNHTQLCRLAVIAGCWLGFASLASPAHATCATDTVVVYGSTRFYGGGGSPAWTLYDPEYFSTTTSWGRRYIIELRNGSPALSGVSLAVDGREWIGTDEFGSGISYLTRTVDFADGSHSHSIELTVQGGASAYVDVRVYHVTEPMFKVYGRKSFIKPSPAAAQVDSFMIPVGAKSGYKMRVFNGDSTGSHRTNNCTVKLNNVEVLSSYEFTTGTVTLTRAVTLLAGGSQNRVEINNQGAASSRIDVEFTATDSTAPYITGVVPNEGTLTEASSLTVSGNITDETPVTVTINGGTAIKTNTTFSQSFSMPADGNYTITIHAANSACFTSDSVRHVARDNLPPAFTVRWPTTGSPSSDSTSIALAGYWGPDTIMTYITVDGDTIASGRSGAFNLAQAYPLDFGPNRIVLRAIDALGHATTWTRYAFRKTAGEGAGPDSTMYPPVLNAIQSAWFVDQVSWLYLGDTRDSILQKGIVVDSIRSDLAGVARGRVSARDFGAIANVKVRVLGHPEYGYTLTRADGRFDLVVNGGAPLTLRFTKAGYLEAQRVFQVPIGGYALEDNVALIGKSTKRLWVPFDSLRVVGGRLANDANGDRKLRLLFQPGTLAKIVKTSGDTASLSGMHLYLTEYTVGSDGPRAMPASLPAASAYTYCADFSVDEADSIGNYHAPTLPAPDVLFTKPVMCYVPNFLHLPVGRAVPYGYYDRRAGKWIAEPDGWVIKILTNNGTTVTVDSKGNGIADGQPRLDSLGISTGELQKLSGQYAAGDTIWREVATRFSNCDFNLLFGFMTGLGPPSLGGAPPNKKPPGGCPETVDGSIIDCEDRTLGERLGITGTQYTLNYRSFRSAGDLLLRSVVVPILADPSVLGGLTPTKAIVRLEVAGKVYEQTISNPSISTPPVPLVWDGKNVYNRYVPGSVLARVSLGYMFRTSYGAGNGGRSLDGPGSPGNGLGDATGDRQVERGLWAREWIFLGVPGTASDGFGGWTISPHHVYDASGSGTVYLGNGSVIRGDLLPNSVRSVSCPSSCSSTPTSLDKIAAYPRAMAFGPDGRFYFANAKTIGGNDYSVYRANANGSSLTRIAGNGSLGTYVDGVAGTTTPLPHPVTSLAVGADGSVYLACSDDGSESSSLVAVVAPDGKIHKIIGGNGSSNFGGGDGLLASQAYVGYVASLAVGPDGSLYILDGGYTDLVHSNTEKVHVRRIGTNGMIANYAGRGGTLGNSDSTGIATQLPINYTLSIAADDAGSVYLVTPLGVRRVATDGTIKTLMGKPGPDGDQILTGTVSRDGVVYVATAGDGFWRRDTDGTLKRIGGEEWGSSWSNGSAPVAFAGVSHAIWPYVIAVAQDGNPWLAMSNAILRVDGPFGTSSDVVTVPSSDGSEYYAFTKSGPTAGRHLYTRDALTGSVRFRFGYDQAGQLSRIYDINGDSTLISRSGNTTTITSPYGLQTTLTLDGRGFLTTVANPKNDAVTLETHDNGLLQSYTDGRNLKYTYTYGDDGRLSLDSDPAGGSQELSVEYAGFDRTVTRETGEGRETTYEAKVTTNGTQQRLITGPDDLRTFQSDSTDGRSRVVLPDNTSQTDSLVPDPRFHVQAPVLARSTIYLPNGISRSIETEHVLSSGFNPPFVAGTWKEELRLNPDVSQFRQNNPLKGEFNSTSRQITVTTPEGRQATAVVDSAGNPTTVTVSGLASLVRQYDARGRLTQSQLGGRVWQCAYDDSGRLAIVTDPLSRVTHYRYDAANQVIRIELPGNRQVSFAYDANGNLTEFKPPGRPTHEFTYTNVDLTDQYRPPTAGLSASRTQYRYDKDRELTRIEAPDSGNVTFGYHSTKGRLEAIALSRGTFGISYENATGHVSSITSPDTVSVAYGYNGVFDTSSTSSGRVVGSVSVTLDRDLQMWYQRVKGDSVGFTYDHDGLLRRAGSLAITRRSDNGLLSGTSIGSVTTAESQTSVGEQWRVTAKYNSTTLWQATYGRDSLGRITTVTETIQGGADTVFTYAYSDTGFLKTVSVDNAVKERYVYDGNGNRIKFERGGGADTSTATYDDQDRLLRYGNTRYTYTAAGRLSKSKISSDSTLYTYDPLENLVTVQLPTGDRIDYLIDGQQRRVGRKLNGALQRKWLYQDQFEPVAELNSADSLLARFVYGTRAHVPDYMVKGGATYRIVSDHLGSVRLVVNVATGAVVQRMDYDGYGRVLLDTNPGFQPFGYAGGLWDNTTGLVRFGTRDYDPKCGRWTSPEPRLEPGSSAYTYVADDPINWIDIDGYHKVPPGGQPPGGNDLAMRELEKLLEQMKQGKITWQQGNRAARPILRSASKEVRAFWKTARKLKPVRGMGVAIFVLMELADPSEANPVELDSPPPPPGALDPTPGPPTFRYPVPVPSRHPRDQKHPPQINLRPRCD